MYEKQLRGLEQKNLGVHLRDPLMLMMYSVVRKDEASSCFSQVINKVLH